jgi:Spy/CpxP family protein refolding chaperone
MKKVYALVIATLFLALATTVLAAPPGPGPKDPSDMRGAWGHPAAVEKFINYLDLTPDQRNRMREIGNRFWDETRDLRYQIKFRRLEMKKLFTDPKTDEQTLIAKQNELQTLVFKLMQRKGQMKIEWRRVLTPEQIQKLDRMPKRFHMGQHRDHDMM